MPDVRLAETQEAAHLRAGETILAGLHRAGFSITAGCRRGGCGICKADLVEGEVGYERTVSDEVLTPAERASGVCLPCRAVPRGDIAIALKDGSVRICSPLLKYLNAVPTATTAGTTTTGTTTTGSSTAAEKES